MTRTLGQDVVDFAMDNVKFTRKILAVVALNFNDEITREEMDKQLTAIYQDAEEAYKQYCLDNEKFTVAPEGWYPGCNQH